MPTSYLTRAGRPTRAILGAVFGALGLLSSVYAAEPQPTQPTPATPTILSIPKIPTPNANASSPKWSPSSNRYIERKFSDYGPFEMAALTHESSALNVYLSAGPLVVDRAVVEKWITTAADAVSAFYGHFPVPKVTLVLLVAGRDGVCSGTTFGGRLIRMRFGPHTKEAEFTGDWTLTHEMFHLAFPDLDDSHLWMEEGMAVYFEPLARARIGNLSDEEVWRGMADGMRKGLPRAGDEGLDRTHTWGRTYWGGALFWFQADIDIRKATHNTHSADDALRAILAHHGDGTRHWEMADVLAAADTATETHVISELYAKQATHPVDTDLAALWKALGVSVQGRTVSFDDSAPLACIRRALTDPRENRKSGE